MATEVVVMLRSPSRIRCRSSNGNRGKSKSGGAGVMVVVEWYSKVWTNKGGFKHDKQQRHGIVERERTGGRVCIQHSNELNTVW